MILGDFNAMLGTVQILEGLTEEDFIAFPDEELCQVGASTTHDDSSVEEVESEVE